MGGLVARRYIQIFGEESVNKAILIATPNKGIDGSVKNYCKLFGEKRECEDMYSDSTFLKKVNNPNYKTAKVEFYTISGSGCKTGNKDGDGLVTLESSKMNSAKSYVINGTCTDTFKRSLHTDLLNIDKYPQVYDYIKEIIGIQ